MKKIAITAILTSVICFGISAATGLGSRQGEPVIQPGGSVRFADLQLACLYETSNFPGHAGKPQGIFCTRPNLTAPAAGPGIWADVFKFQVLGAKGAPLKVLYTKSRVP